MRGDILVLHLCLNVGAIDHKGITLTGWLPTVHSDGKRSGQ